VGLEGPYEVDEMASHDVEEVEVDHPNCPHSLGHVQSTPESQRQ
jgi:hypothetical protein